MKTSSFSWISRTFSGKGKRRLLARQTCLQNPGPAGPGGRLQIGSQPPASHPQLGQSTARMPAEEWSRSQGQLQAEGQLIPGPVPATPRQDCPSAYYEIGTGQTCKQDAGSHHSANSSGPWQALNLSLNLQKVWWEGPWSSLSRNNIRTQLLAKVLDGWTAAKGLHKKGAEKGQGRPESALKRSSGGGGLTVCAPEARLGTKGGNSGQEAQAWQAGVFLALDRPARCVCESCFLGGSQAEAGRPPSGDAACTGLSPSSHALCFCDARGRATTPGPKQHGR